MIRPATLDDAPAIAHLFFERVRNVNSADYDDAQIAAWAGAAPDAQKWRERQSTRVTIVDVDSGRLRGFAELRGDHIDAFYVNHRCIRQGIGRALLRRLEREASERGLACLEIEASLTARAFFESFGYALIEAQSVFYRGASFRNFRMRKSIASAATESARPLT